MCTFCKCVLCFVNLICCQNSDAQSVDRQSGSYKGLKADCVKIEILEMPICQIEYKLVLRQGIHIYVIDQFPCG